MKWQVESTRFTVFVSPSAKISASDWWSSVVDAPPESHASRPREGFLQDTGAWGGGRLTLMVNPPRIDWIYGVDIGNIGPELDKFPALGEFQPEATRLVDLIHKWLPNCPESTRIAWGTVLSFPVADRKAGYLALSNYLHALKIDAEDSTDLIYQINRHRKSKVMQDLSLNRLSKWAVALIQPLTIQISPAGGALTQGSGLTACRLELDVNTAPEEQAPLPRNFLEPLLDELVALTKEIAERGDVS